MIRILTLFINVPPKAFDVAGCCWPNGVAGLPKGAGVGAKLIKIIDVTCEHLKYT